MRRSKYQHASYIFSTGLIPNFLPSTNPVLYFANHRRYSLLPEEPPSKLPSIPANSLHSYFPHSNRHPLIQTDSKYNRSKTHKTRKTNNLGHLSYQLSTLISASFTIQENTTIPPLSHLILSVPNPPILISVPPSHSIPPPHNHPSIYPSNQSSKALPILPALLFPKMFNTYPTSRPLSHHTSQISIGWEITVSILLHNPPLRFETTCLDNHMTFPFNEILRLEKLGRYFELTTGYSAVPFRDRYLVFENYAAYLPVIQRDGKATASLIYIIPPNSIPFPFSEQAQEHSIFFTFPFFTPHHNPPLRPLKNPPYLKIHFLRHPRIQITSKNLQLAFPCPWRLG